jgi:RNA polymerase sigma-70 factor (ECF subfamily)
MEADSFEKRFLETYDMCADSIFRLCFSKTSNREVAVDLVQETFTKMWDYVARGNEIQNMRAFAFTTARNLIKDYYKKKRPIYEHEMLDDPPDQPDTTQSPETYAESTQLMLHVRKLKDSHREVLLLRFVEGVGVKDIADMLGERENTVSVRINRALKELREFFDGDRLEHHG